MASAIRAHVSAVVLLAVPTMVVVLLSVVPIFFVFSDSLGGTANEGVGLANYERFTTSIFAKQTWFSITLAALVSIVSVGLVAPFTYLLTGLPKTWQSLWLIYLLAQISLSEVLIAFAWQILLSNTTGITQVFIWSGLMTSTSSLTPSFGAVVVALTYLSVPFAVLVLYPSFSRLDRRVVEAARTLGASSVRAFMTIVLPMMTKPIMTALMTLFILNLGAIIVPQILGRPRHWTLAVHITDQALFQFNTAFASALAIILLILSAAMLVFLRRYGQTASR